MQGKGRLVMAHLILTKFTKEFDSGRNLKSDKTLVSNLMWKLNHVSFRSIAPKCVWHSEGGLPLFFYFDYFFFR